MYNCDLIERKQMTKYDDKRSQSPVSFTSIVEMSGFRLPLSVYTDHLYDVNMIEWLRDIAQSSEYNLNVD